MGPQAEVHEILTVLQKNRLMDSLTFVSLKETLDQLAAALHPTPLQNFCKKDLKPCQVPVKGVQVPLALNTDPSGSAPGRSSLPLAFP